MGRHPSWTVDFITGLPLDTGYNAIYTYIDKFTKLVKIIPYVVGDGDLSALATTKLFFDHVFCNYRVF